MFSAFTVNLCHHLHFSSSFPPLLHAPAYLPLSELVLPLPLTGLPPYEPVLPLHALPLQPLLQIASPPSPHVLASASSSSSEDLLTASDCQHVAYRSKADIQTPCKLYLFHNCSEKMVFSCQLFHLLEPTAAAARATSEIATRGLEYGQGGIGS